LITFFKRDRGSREREKRGIIGRKRKND